MHKPSLELAIIADLVRIIDRITGCAHPVHKPIFALTTFINNQLFIMADITLTIGTPKTGVFTLLDPSLDPITNAVFFNQTVGTNSNPALATFAFDPGNPNNPIATGLTAGSGTIDFSTNATYTFNGQSFSASFGITKNYLVSASGVVTFDVPFN